MRNINKLQAMLDKEVFNKPYKDIKLIKDLDTFEVAFQISLILRATKDEPLVTIKNAIGKKLLSMSGLFKESRENNTLCVWIGNRVLLPLITNGYALFTNKKEETFNGKISTSSWRVSKNGDSISIKNKKGYGDGYVFEILQEEWFDNLFEELGEEIETQDSSSLPQFEDIKPFEGFYHPITNNPMVHGAPRLVRRKIDQGRWDKFTRILNNRLALKYKVNQEVLSIYEKCQRDTLFTLSDKKMNAKQKKSVKDERKYAMQDAKACGDKEFSFYHFYDKRMGRIYSEGNFLKPDGNKCSKSLLRLANKKAIGEKGWKWMLVHASNTYGEDGGSIDSRVEFANTNLNEWIDIARNPIKDKRWQKADDPFGFLATIIELKNAIDHGNKFEYESGLIVAFDAKNSGLQVLSALVRDEISGAMCNIFGDESSDFYLTIADDVWTGFEVTKEHRQIYKDVMKELEGINRVNDFNNKIKELGNKFEIAAKVFWSDKFDLRRKLAKRPCMTYFYSCQAETMAEAIYKDWRTEPGFKDLNPGFAIILSEKLYNTCKKVMRKPTIVMEVIIEAAERDRKQGQQFWIRTPYTGAIMEQSYFKPNKTTVLRLSDPTKETNRIRLRVWNGLSKTINHHKVKSASAPNLVHMLDSQLVAWCIDNCDYDVSLIHDSFGTIPANADYLFDDIRAGFYEIFNKPVLEKMLRKKGYEDLIEKLEYGKGNLEDIFYNEGAFS